MPDYEVKHTTYEEEQAFLRLSPDQQNLKIFKNGRETNGSVALALRQIAELRVQFGNARADLDNQLEKHDQRLGRLEKWQIGAAAVVALLIFIGPAVFWALANHWH